MKKLIVLAMMVAVVMMSGCQKKHPVKVQVDPALDEQAAKIAVFPFLSAIHEAEDPDGIASAIMEKYFSPALDARDDYTFISEGTVRYAIDGEGWMEEYANFVEEYPRTGKIDPEFFEPLANVLRTDAFLVPVVDLWQKDEVDYQENATPATYVGATITIFDRTGQKVLFLASDEDYIEGARSETSDRGVISTAGRVRSDAGAKTHRAPPYDEVAIKVIEALVGSLPLR
jgi:hypothetical protein